MSQSRQRGALRPKLIAVSVAACFAFSSPQIFANPTGPSIVSGSALFAGAGNALTITNSANAIINWQGFSIGINEITRFIQPSALSAVLNRVTGSNGVIPQSVIDGILSSNGRVYLINPSGIVIGAGATIDVSGMVMSSLNLSDQDFLSGRLRFTEVPGAGAVVNNGIIQTAAGGNVYLIAPTVENNGLIRSPQGEIVLAAGKSVELVSDSSPYVTVRVTADTEQAVNVGSLIADSGRIGVYGALVRNAGVAEANGAVVGAGGQIRFVATKDLNIEAGSRIAANGGAGGNVVLQAEGGTNLVAGTVEATGSSGKGGSVQALGVRVGVIGHGVIDASGETGGGTVLVGGDYQGKNPGVQNAQSTEIGADGVIRADARTTGDGGRVIVWADGDTKFSGTISARGGAQSGNGGFVETSGEQHLTATGLVNTGAPNGKGGMWLLDPATDQLIDAALASSLAASMSYGGSATVNAGNDINFGASIAAAGTTGSFSATAGNNVNLFSQSITVGTGSVNLNAIGGSITSTIPAGATQITTSGGYVGLSGHGVTVGGIVTRGANGASPGASGQSGGSVDISANGGAVSTGAIDTSGGNGAAGATAYGGSGGSGGQGGSVTIYGSSIMTGSINTAGGQGGNGGSASSNANGGQGGSGGSLYVNATGAVQIASINTAGGQGGNGGSVSSSNNYASGGDGGEGGSVTVYGSSIMTGAVNVSGGPGGAGGSASFTYGGFGGSAGSVSYYGGAGGITITGVLLGRGGAGGVGGSVTDGNGYSDGGSGRSGAIVSLTGPMNSSSELTSTGPVSTRMIDVSGGNGANSGPVGTSYTYADPGGDAGSVTIKGTTVTVNGAILARGGDAGIVVDTRFLYVGGFSYTPDAFSGGHGGIVDIRSSGEVKINQGATLSPGLLAIDTRGGAGGRGGDAHNSPASPAGAGGDGGNGGDVIIGGTPKITLLGSINSSGGAGGAGGAGATPILGGPGGQGGLGGDITLDAGQTSNIISVFAGTTFTLSAGAGGAGGDPGGLAGMTAFDFRDKHFGGLGNLSITGQLVPIDPLSDPEVSSPVGRIGSCKA